MSSGGRNRAITLAGWWCESPLRSGCLPTPSRACQAQHHIQEPDYASCCCCCRVVVLPSPLLLLFPASRNPLLQPSTTPTCHAWTSGSFLKRSQRACDVRWRCHPPARLRTAGGHVSGTCRSRCTSQQHYRHFCRRRGVMYAHTHGGRLLSRQKLFDTSTCQHCQPGHQLYSRTQAFCACCGWADVWSATAAFAHCLVHAILPSLKTGQLGIPHPALYMPIGSAIPVSQCWGARVHSSVCKHQKLYMFDA